MRKHKRLLICMSVVASFLSLIVNTSGVPAEERGECSVAVDVWGFKSNKGFAMIGIWTNRDKWLDDTEKVTGMRVPIRNLKAQARFDHLICGSYAIAVYHDMNENGIHDKNYIGIPREGYGFSGIGDYRMGSAKYEEALVQVRDKENYYKIKIVNIL